VNGWLFDERRYGLNVPVPGGRQSRLYDNTEQIKRFTVCCIACSSSFHRHGAFFSIISSLNWLLEGFVTVLSSYHHELHDIRGLSLVTKTTTNFAT
jgi:hypothetical protein